jgi:hypothetical protein
LQPHRDGPLTDAAQMMRQAVGAPLDLPIAQLPRAIDHRHRIRCALRLRTHQFVQASILRIRSRRLVSLLHHLTTFRLRAYLR